MNARILDGQFQSSGLCSVEKPAKALFALLSDLFTRNSRLNVFLLQITAISTTKSEENKITSLHTLSLGKSLIGTLAELCYYVW